MLRIIKSVISLSKDELIDIEPRHFFTRQLSEGEIMYLAKTLGACWKYDYEAAARGKVGMHAILKCGAHSDIFFNAKIFLDYENIREIIAHQLADKYRAQPSAERPDWVLGIPDGAKKLGENVARLLKSRPAVMVKEGDRMTLKSRICSFESVFVVEDLCTRGTGLTEAVREVRLKQPRALMLWYELAVVNREGLGYVNVSDIHEFTVVSLARLNAHEWPADKCPLCQAGSESIKPKATDENWRLLTASQF